MDPNSSAVAGNIYTRWWWCQPVETKQM